LYAPDTIHNLISNRKLDKCNHEVLFKKKSVYVISQYGSIRIGFINNNLYVMGQTYCANVVTKFDVESESMKWHNRSGHIGHDMIACLVKHGLIGSLTLSPCEPCLADKAKKGVFCKAKRASAPLDLIHSDIC